MDEKDKIDTFGFLSEDDLKDLPEEGKQKLISAAKQLKNNYSKSIQQEKERLRGETEAPLLTRINELNSQLIAAQTELANKMEEINRKSSENDSEYDELIAVGYSPEAARKTIEYQRKREEKIKQEIELKIGTIQDRLLSEKANIQNQEERKALIQQYTKENGYPVDFIEAEASFRDLLTKNPALSEQIKRIGSTEIAGKILYEEYLKTLDPNSDLVIASLEARKKRKEEEIKRKNQASPTTGGDGGSPESTNDLVKFLREVRNST